MRSLLACGLAASALLLVGPVFRGGVSAGTAVRLEVADLAVHSGLIVEARVLSAQPVDLDGMVITEYLIEVERSFEGSDAYHQSVRLPGGVRADGSGMLLAGMPRVSPGDTALFFLTEESPNGLRMPVGLAQGKFDVVVLADGSKRLVREGADVSLLNPSTGRVSSAPGRAIYDYAQIVAEIETGLAKKRAR